MQIPGAGRAAALMVGAALSTLSVTACSGGSNESQIQSGTVVSTIETSTTAAGATSTTGSTSSTAPKTPEVASAEAESFKAVAPTIGELGAGVQGLVEVIEPTRIDQLATGACGDVTSDMTDTELGLQGLGEYRDLTEDEQALISIDDWVVFYGALIGFFCPENLPEFDSTAAPSADGIDVAQFRAIVTDVDGVSAETESFVDRLSDARLDELHTSACDRTTQDMNTEQFGLIIVESYGAELTEAENSRLSLSGYSELYGALVGWFCPANLPL